jgi:hypothetical protein
MSPNTCYPCLRSIHKGEGWGEGHEDSIPLTLILSPKGGEEFLLVPIEMKVVLVSSNGPMSAQILQRSPKKRVSGGIPSDYLEDRRIDRLLVFQRGDRKCLTKLHLVASIINNPRGGVEFPTGGEPRPRGGEGARESLMFPSGQIRYDSGADSESLDGRGKGNVPFMAPGDRAFFLFESMIYG